MATAFHALWRITAIATAMLGSVALAAQPTDWSAATSRDARQVHDLLLENHPGAVDPQSPVFRARIESGYQTALAEAESVRTEADYVRALRRYINSFRDGHVFLSFDGLADPVWPGFLGHESDDGRLRVTVAEADAPVPVGAEIHSCDGRSGRELIDELVVPFRVNADIPHERASRSVYVFVARPDDTRRPVDCRVVSNGKASRVRLSWRPIAGERLGPLLAQAQDTVRPPLGMREEGGVIFISLPSFNFFGADADPIKQLLQRIEAERERLRKAPFVIVDVRGNGGGNSGWGNAVATALYGEALVKPIVASFDWTVDWRVSTRNMAVMRANAERSAASGLAEDAAYRGGIADRMRGALSAGQTFVRDARPGSPLTTPATSSPFKGKVYFLTDSACASACLDFADIMVRLPGVAHVGLPTSGDAIYIDNYSIPLADSPAVLSMSLKVYRNRVRGNNVFYTPAHRWPAGRMEDEAVAAWVRGLP